MASKPKRLYGRGADVLGIAAWPLVDRLMAALARNGAISGEDGVEIIDRALSDLEKLSTHYDGPALSGPRVTLEGYLKSWHRDFVAPKKSRPAPRRRRNGRR